MAWELSGNGISEDKCSEVWPGPTDYGLTCGLFRRIERATGESLSRLHPKGHDSAQKQQANAAQEWQFPISRFVDDISED